MIRAGDMRQLVESHVTEHGEGKRLQAFQSAADQVSRLLSEGKWKPYELKIPMIAEATIPCPDGMSLAELSEPMNSGRLQEAMVSSAFPYVTGKLINDQIISNYTLELGNLLSLLCEEGEMDDYPDSSVVGFEEGDQLDKVEESVAYPETTVAEKRVQVRGAKFGRIISLTREMIHFDKTNQILTQAQRIGQRTGQLIARHITQTVEVVPRTGLGETTTTLRAHVSRGTVITISNHYNSDHSAVTGLDGQVNDNSITSAATISDAVMTTAYQLFAAMLDEKGEPITVVPKIIFCHPLRAIAAWKLVNSIQVLGSANNDMSFFGPQGGLKLSVVTSPYIGTSTEYWYVGDFKKQLMWLWGWRPSMASQTSTSEMAFTSDIVQRYKWGYMGGVAHTNYVHIVRGQIA